MFTEQTNKPPSMVVKTYLRLKDKKSFPVMLKLPIVLSDLKDIIVKKTKISEDDIIVMLHGKQIDFKNQSQFLQLKDRSILHVINKKYLRNDIFELVIRLILRNQEKSCLGQVKLFAKADQSIEEFIQNQVLPVIQERTDQKLNTDCVNLVSNGNLLKKKLRFHNYLIENGAEIICMINFIEDLQKSVKNISSHRLIGSHRQVQLYRSLNTQPTKKQQIITKQEKKTTQQQESSKQIQTKQHQANKVQDQESKITLQRKQNLAPKFYQSESKQKLSPTLYPQFADLLNKDITDGWQEQPESPVSVEYPKAQQKSQSYVQWYDQKAAQQKTEEEHNSEFNLQKPQNLEEKPQQSESKQQKEVKQKQEQIKLPKEESKIKLGDFLVIGKMENHPQNKTQEEFIEEMSQKLDSFFQKKYEASEFSQIAIQYPQIQKKFSVKPGDLIICGDMFMNSSRLINQALLQKFNDLIQKKNKKMQGDYDLQQRLNEEKKFPSKQETTQITTI